MAIIASGPSTKKTDPQRLRSLPVLAIKRNVELYPWAEAVYGCDLPWWRSVEGLRDFKGLKVSYDRRACDDYGCHKVEIPQKLADQLLFGETGVVGAGGNSGFQALNLAVQFGATRILLVGFDMHDRNGVHWYGRNTAYQMSNPDRDNFRRWVKAFGNAAVQLKEKGVEVVNASASSDLACFPKASVADTLKAWGLHP